MPPGIRSAVSTSITFVNIGQLFQISIHPDVLLLGITCISFGAIKLL